AVRRRAHRLPRSCRSGAAGAGRRTHARSDAVIRRTKIVVTLGPATATPERIAGLIEAGANVIRVNASHGTPELRAGWIAATRQAADDAGAPIAILVDLQGPRIRVGELAQPRVLRAGEQVVFAPEAVGGGAATMSRWRTCDWRTNWPSSGTSCSRGSSSSPRSRRRRRSTSWTASSGSPMR